MIFLGKSKRITTFRRQHALAEVGCLWDLNAMQRNCIVNGWLKHKVRNAADRMERKKFLKKDCGLK